MRALIVDSGLRNLGGHNFSYTRAVERELRARGWTVEVLANRALGSELVRQTGYRPVFALGAYDFPPYRGRSRDLAYVHAQAVVQAEALETALGALGHAPDLVFSHTLGDFELLGWARLARRLRPRRRVVLLLRNTPGYSRRPSWKVRLNPFLWLRPGALRALHRHLDGRFTLATDSALLTADYAHVYPHRILTLPIPIPDALVARAEARERSGIVGRYGLVGHGPCVGYLGDARTSKGFDLLPEALGRLLADGSAKATFVVQCPPPASATSTTPDDPAHAALADLAAKHPGRLTLVPERLTEEDYADLLGRLDVVLIPYLREGYVEPTSGIFAEALAVGKVVVVPEGTWMAHELGPAGAGAAFASGRAEDLAGKIDSVLTGYEALARRATARAGEWRSFHNAGRLADMLIETATSPSGSE